MSAVALRCRICERPWPLEPVGVCSDCLGPLDPIYDRDEQRRTVSRESIAAGPPSLWRYGPLLPVPIPREQRLAPGFTPLIAAPRLANALGIGELWLKLDTANPTHSFKDRVVAVACAKALAVGRRTLACSSTGNLAHAVAARAAAEGVDAVVLYPADRERGELAATAAYGARILAVEGTSDDCSRLSVELSFEPGWASVDAGLRPYYAEGAKTIAYEVAEQLDWQLPDAVVAPLASGALYTKLHQGFRDLLDLHLVDGTPPRLIGAQAAGCAPIANAFTDGKKITPLKPATLAGSLAIGNPVDGDLALATATATGGAIHAVPETAIRENIRLLAETTGIFGEAASAVALGALRQTVANGDLGERDCVVLLITGDGLTTTSLVASPAQTTVRARSDVILETLSRVA